MANASSELGDLERAIELFKAIVDRGLREGPELPDTIAEAGLQFKNVPNFSPIILGDVRQNLGRKVGEGDADVGFLGPFHPDEAVRRRLIVGGRGNALRR